MNKILLANIIGLLAGACSLISYWGKNKEKILKIQLLDNLFHTLENLVVFSGTGILLNSLAFIRSIFNIKIKTKNIRLFNFSYAVIVIILGIIFNNKGNIGLIIILASVIYTLGLNSNNAQVIRLCCIANQILWLIYELYLHLYTSAIIKIIIIISTSLAIIKYKEK